MRLDVEGFAEFCSQLIIPSRDAGLVPLRLWNTQRYCLEQIAAGLEDGIHDFVILKGRQLGETTKNDAFRLWWPQVNDGVQGLFVSNSDENRDFRRDVCLEMLAGLPRPYRHEVRVNNRNLLAWQPNGATGFRGSRLMFATAGARQDSDLGRSRGINFLDADEVGLWPSEHDVEALRASLSTRNPTRLYTWNGTGKGYNIFYYMCETAKTATTQRFIFIGWYRHELNRVDQSNRKIWDKYGQDRMTSDERLWIREVKRAYGIEIEPEQLVCYRWALDEMFYGDEAMRAQEWPCLPEDAFQAFGDKFIPEGVIRRLHAERRHAPKPSGYSYEAGQHFDETTATPCAPAKAPLLVWQEPEPGSAYIIAGHPWGSSDPNATEWVCQVWRAWPDALVQCAEYSSETGTTYAFAWLLIYLAGAYNLSAQPFVVVEAGGPGYAVMKELQLMQERGYGLSSSARAAGLQDVLGSMRRYYWARPDNLGWRTAPLDIKTNPDILPYLLHALADGVIRGHLTIRSVALINALAALRRGASGDNDQIAGRGMAHAMCAALAVRCWADFAMNDLITHVAPKEVEDRAPKSMGEVLVSDFLQRLARTGRAR